LSTRTSRLAMTVLLAALLSMSVAVAATAKSKKSSKVAIKGTTTLALDSGAAAALESLGITAAPIAPATAGDAGLAFPITSARLNGKTLAGSIPHTGGISLTKGETVVNLERFTIKIDKSQDLTARVGGSRVSILNLDLSDAKITKTKKQVTVAGVKATLTKAAADALNAAFGTDAFKEGLLLGDATVAGKIRK
jgi:hypothetical protein